ncbi:unnamed protein product [Umbelopsis ramanniana]
MAQQHQLADDNDLLSDLTCGKAIFIYLSHLFIRHIAHRVYLLETFCFDLGVDIAICQELYYQPVTLIMCLHVFCASCYSQHLARQRDCPICREEVIGVRRNHTMAKIVNVYVRLNPSMERSASEKATCDLLNVINDNIDFSSDGSTRAIAIRDHRYLMYPVPCRSCPTDNDTGYICPNPIAVNENTILGPSLPTSWDIPTPADHLRCYDCERFMPARYANGEPSLLQVHFVSALTVIYIGAVSSQSEAISGNWQVRTH